MKTDTFRGGGFDSHPVHIKAQTAIKLAMVIITILLKNVPCTLIKALTAKGVRQNRSVHTTTVVLCIKALAAIFSPHRLAFLKKARC